MDPGTIIAVITAAGKLLSILFKYVSDAKDAVEGVKRLSDQVDIIRSLLLEIGALAKASNAAELPASSMALTAIRQSLSDIELVEKLNPKTSQKTMRKMRFRALKWPFTKEQVAEYIRRLESDKGSLILALQADST